jgi:putative SOS response-associated peptidase YedK
VCYSAQVKQAYQEYVRMFGAEIDIREFVKLYASREMGAKVKTTKAMDDAFLRVGTSETDEIVELIVSWNKRQATELEQLLFQQRKRLAGAERTLAKKPTKKALEDQRIATNKIEWAKSMLTDLRRTTSEDRDRRIFPGVYAPVMVMEDGKRVIKPMRYQCRPAGKPAFYDTKYPGTYNARRDNLDGFWKGQFNHTHGIIVCDAFYENVSRHKVESRELADGEVEENVVLKFQPQPRQDMLIACLYSRWKQGGDELWSFAAITDEPAPEVAAAGHDRTVIQIEHENVDRWLTPEGRTHEELQTILSDRPDVYYEHKQIAA